MLVNFFSDENLLSVDYTDKFNSEFSGVGSKLKGGGGLYRLIRNLEKQTKRIMAMVMPTFAPPGSDANVFNICYI